MACEICRMSCSLCPYCCTDNCPSFVERKKAKVYRYWIYATSRKGSYLEPIFKTNDKEELIKTLKEIECRKFIGKWNKKFLYTLLCGKYDKKRHCYPNAKEVFTPIVQLTITELEGNWATAVHLALDLKENTLYYYDRQKADLTYARKPCYMGKWDGEVNFRRR